MTTLDTITDDQIRALRRCARRAGDDNLIELCHVALYGPPECGDAWYVARHQRDARAECAQLIAETEVSR